MGDFHQINKQLQKISGFILCSEYRESIKIEGEINSWEDYIKAGKIAAKSSYKGVINNLTVKGLFQPPPRQPALNDHFLDGKKVDVLIIGGGIIGSAISRYLSQYDISILLVDKEDDLAMHQSSRNDGMIHPGVNPKPKSNKAKYNVRGNYLFEKLAKDLDVPFERIGTHFLFDSQVARLFGYLLLNRAEKNGVPGVKMISRKELLRREPRIKEDIKWAIHMPTTGVCPPYKMTIALAENAVMNGVEISLNTYVKGMELTKDHIYSVKTNRGTLYPRVVINAAGVYSDHIAEMAGDRFFTIHPRKGEILLLDKAKQDYINSVMAKFNIKTIRSTTKGGGLVRTIEGNILVGPDAYEQPFKEEYSTHAANINKLINTRLSYIRGLERTDVITYLAGTRAATFKEDFIIEASEHVNNLIHAAGIQSPGYASAPAIAEEIEKITVKILSRIMYVKKKAEWIPTREGIKQINLLSDTKRNAYIKANRNYGIIICRCEEISKGEIIDALNSPIPVNSLDAVKRRTRAGMGRCQGGFCAPLVSKIIADHNHCELCDITKKGKGSELLTESIYKEEYNEPV
ncbi:NAD(P)/FAD-dependent oxidoreductase [Vallitalea okinawensis]|uniref:NAD(P)/FAD-dependent oxidoreductase n=1 Tax=Vallitalea okinawensis TaxID=2078660 RepID=UPI0014786105|nr:NAD(P)/FAD-dependent oxidoreductase [Vallitalea okinawensis]